MKIFIDGDDTIAAFRRHAVSRGVPDWSGSWYTTDPSTWTQEQKNTQAATNAQMRMTDFWATMPIIPGAHDLIAASFAKVGRLNTYILTALPTFADKEPGITERIFHAKREYYQHVFSIFSPQIVICRRPEKIKHAYDHFGGQNVLVDDAEQNVREWKDANGIAHLHDNMSQSIDFIKGL